MNKIGLIFGGVIAIVALFVFGGSFYTVDEGERAVITSQGKISGISEPGFHWKKPFIDDAHTVSLRDGMLQYKDIEVYTRDAQTATVHNISISYRVKPSNESVTEVYARYGTAENAVSQMVSRRVGETLEQVFGQFTADTAIQKRGELGLAFSNRIKAIDGPVEIVAAQIENFSLPDSYEKNVAEKMTQEVEVKKLEEKAKQAEVNARISVTNAKAAAEVTLAAARAQAEGQLAQATATADGNRLIGLADAAAIKARSDAISANPNLIEYQKAITWNGALPTSMVPGATIPFMQIK